jgi:hypothetical protein
LQTYRLGNLFSRSYAGAVVFILLATFRAGAQTPRNVPERPGWILVPSLQFAPVYEDNVLFTPAPHVGSQFFRLTPRLDAFYERGSRRFDGFYTLDAERYPERFALLNDAFARQEGVAQLRTLLSRRSSLVVEGRFLSTTRPEEVLRDTGLLALRRRSRSIVGSAQFTRALDRRFSWTAGYAYSLRDFERPEGLTPRLGGTMHSVVTGFSFRQSPRTTSAWAYGLRVYVEDDIAKTVTPFTTFVSQAATYRWSRRLTRKIDVVVAVGPRFSEGLRAIEDRGFERVRDVSPEAFASFVYKGDGKFFAVQYNRTQSQAFGLSGFVDTQNGSLTAVFDFGPRFRIEATPGIYQNTRAGITTSSYQADVTVEYQFSSWGSIESSYTFQYQDRLLAVIDGVLEASNESIRRNSVLFGVKLFKVYGLN